MGPLSSLSGVGVWERGPRGCREKNKGNAGKKKSAHGLLFVRAFQTKVNRRCACVRPAQRVLVTSWAGLHLGTDTPKARLIKQKTVLCLGRNTEQHCRLKPFCYLLSVSFVRRKITVCPFLQQSTTPTVFSGCPLCTPTFHVYVSMITRTCTGGMGICVWF